MQKFCKKEIPTHSEARKIVKQLKTNPEVCDGCKIKPCTYAIYLYGRPKDGTK